MILNGADGRRFLIERQKVKAMSQNSTQKIFNIEALEDFYRQVSDEKGIDVVEFQKKLNVLFQRPRTEDDIKAYRLGKGPWKKLRDEVSPVSRYLHFRGIDNGRVRFPLSDLPPDCVFWEDDEAKK
ncbi:MAG: hypothetical protein GC185_13330 [Alphaproteobacteria bacterium]|nr:hypothetical protein [Alphaproteobacteria bacterium]